MTSKIAHSTARPHTRHRASAPAKPALAHPAPPHLAVIGVALGSAVLLWASFPPLDLWLLGWVAPVPWLMLVRLTPKPRRLYSIIYLAGLGYWLASVQWMRLAHPTMNLAWIAFSIYLAVGAVVTVALCRQMVHRLRVPLVIAAPVTWVGVDFLRAHLLSGFAWYYVAHTQYRWAALIQISDLVGAYGVSFLMVWTAAFVAEAVPLQWFFGKRVIVDLGRTAIGSRRAFAWRVGITVVALGFALGYGFVRMQQADFTEGPKVALIQGNVPLLLKQDASAARRILDDHRSMTLQAARQRPSLIIWPESMLRFPVVQLASGVSDKRVRELFPEQDPRKMRDGFEALTGDLADLSRQAKSALLIGTLAIDVGPTADRTYNSAVYVSPREGLVARYDKVHLVPFGEYLPLASVLPWLVTFTPFPEGYGFDAGDGPVELALGNHRFGVLICFEDTVPHLVRHFASANLGDGRGGLDFLVNVTNDGWFGASSELEQHLITSAFRSVECRTPIVRAANTGISAIINGNGQIVSLARDRRTRRTKEIKAILTARVPLDTRKSQYLRWGDWFAGLCLCSCVLTGFTPLAAVVGRRFTHSA